MGPPLQGPLPAVPHDAGQARRRARAAGTATACPVEVEVEKELGFSAKFEIEDYGIERFNAKCRASVQRYVEDWQSLTSRIGMWLDTAGAYWTLSNEYIESVWWLFRQIWDAGAIYEGFKVVPYCGRCGTALSSHELGQPGAYRDVTEPSVYVRFPLVDRDDDLARVDDHAVDPAVERRRRGRPDDRLRARPRAGGRARPRAWPAPASPTCSATDAEIVADVPVPSLVGARYEPPFTMLAVEGERAYTVVADDFVTIEDGSGIVHLAPAFGEIDREVGEREGLPIVNPVNDAARFEPGRRRAVRGPVREGRRPRPHRRPHGAGQARRGRRLHALVPALLALRHAAHLLGQAHVVRAHVGAQGASCSRENETINWYPEHIKHGRFGDWLENNVDWALSRDRYWGTPIPVWRCHDCNHDTCIGSVAELAELAGPRPRRAWTCTGPYVDDVTIACPQCGDGTAYRIEPVLDAWFDSGSMPAAQFHYPFENTDDVRRRTSPPTSSARRSTRPAAGSTRCSR